ncbi:MAG TPA: tRNA preQ1(34) S-adenosylmethionine ribosyltransferase-isomerase QueA [Eubacteriaceae bacterium]|nr:tRNA preQ1(34) S-adenosylmethionine ribosyltransferase-isomerase QueA [Eubacteriaceae bacterium]
MKTKDFFYDLPQELIAQKPMEPRDHSRMLVLDKNQNTIRHRHFYDLIDELKENDVMVLNNTRVMPARLFGKNPKRQGMVEILLLKRMDAQKWEVMVKPGKKAKIGNEIIFGDRLKGVITDIVEGGLRIMRFEYEGVFEEILDELGHMPLPPYIVEKLEDKERYQTVYSKETGSAAAPTAGLHFTDALLEKIKEKKISLVTITLHVGIGTFRPVKTEEITEHTMHEEFYTIDEEAAKTIQEAKEKGHRVIAVGTTSVRALESSAKKNGKVTAESDWTDIFIYPPYTFRCVDAMVTNFHLPESTLLMLVSAFAGKDATMNAYKEAVAKEYRFFSFGDSMLIK